MAALLLLWRLTHVILEFELKKGIPLNYLDEKGQSCVTQMVIRKPSRCLRAQKFTCQTIPYNSQKTILARLIPYFEEPGFLKRSRAFSASKESNYEHKFDRRT